MIEFLKSIFKNVNFKSKDEELNKANKIIYSVIILCTIVFIGIIIFFLIKFFPTFIDSVQYNWNNAKSMFQFK